MIDIDKKCDEYMAGCKERNPGYALLFSGPWGCGKTYHIQNYIEKSNEVGIWYISLFGVKTKEDIDNKIFEAAHPIMTDKKTKKVATLALAVARGVVKNKLKFDINEFIKPLSDITSIEKEEMKNVSICQAIVFDDIERMELGIKEFFGYIEELLQGIKIILIANEEEIKTDDYLLYKEKIVGETIKIEPDYENAIKCFWGEFDKNGEDDNDEEYIKILQGISEDIGIGNLRIIRQSIHQWFSFYGKLTDDIYKDDEYLKMIFEAFMVINIWYRKKGGESFFDGEIKEKWSDYIGKKKKKNRYLDIGESLNKSELIYVLPCKTLWKSILGEGKYLEKEWIKDNIGKEYNDYIEARRARKESSDELIITNDYIVKAEYDKKEGFDLKENFLKVTKKFQEGSYKEIGKIIMYIRIYCFLLEKEVLPREYSVKRLCDMIDALKKRNVVERIKINYEEWERNNYININEVRNKVKELVESVNDTSKDNLFDDKDAFFELIEKSHNAFGYYEKESILKDVDVNMIMNEYIEEKIDYHNKFLAFLSSRYGYGITNIDMNSLYYDDIPKVKEILSFYNNKCKKMEHKFDEKIIIYKDIKKRYEELVKYVEEEREKSKKVYS